MSELKIQAAKSALSYLDDHKIIGVGTGSTVNFFIDELRKIKSRIDVCVASSLATAARLKDAGFTVIDLNVADDLPIYIDGADEVDHSLQMIKGGGGALTREKILASVAKKFVCMIEDRKYVRKLGEFPIAVEVIPLARSFVAREIVKLGGNPVYRQGFVTDNGNCILDVYNLEFFLPEQMEQTLNQLTGVVENGLFAKRRADHLIVASANGTQCYDDLEN
jgi:ribose 5-phosphate isomerase A